MATGRTARAELLRRVPLFHGISERALDSLVDLVTEVEFPSGRYLAQQGQVGSGLEREPSIALAMLRTLAGRLRDATDPERG
jgi:hypothetical protein